MSDGVIDRSSARFIQVPNHLVLGIKNGNALLVYSILKTYTNQDVKLVYPKRETIARHMGSKTTKPVDGALKVLHDLGLVASFHRFKNGENKISYTKSDEFNQQTSNGYILYDVIHVPGPGWDAPNSNYMPPAYPSGVPNGNVPGSQTATPPGVQMEAPRVAEKVHEVYPLEVHPDEVDKNPPTPQGGEAETSQQIELAQPKMDTVSKKGTRVTADWMPSQPVIDKMQAQFPDMDFFAVHEEFIDYWLGVPGQRGVKLDWDATWRNSIRRSGSRGDYPRVKGQVSTSRASGGHSKADSKALWYAQRAEELARKYAGGDSGAY